MPSTTASTTKSNSFTAGVLAGINHKFTTAHGKHATMEIQLDNHYSAKAYTSSSSLSGRVVIRPSRDTRFDSLQILLMGVTRTRVDGVHAPAATQHTFLKLTMPIPESSYPVPRVYEADRTYSVPFNFVIPSYLTLSACSHKTESDAVSGHHLCIPPSLGGIPSSSSWDKDDMAPDMARVEYTIRARLYRDEEVDKRRTKILEANQVFNVLPAFSEQPPLNITPDDSLYSMTKTKSVRKSILSPKTGKITLTAAQPGAVMVSPNGSAGTTTTSARIDFTYEAASGQSSSSALPKVTEVTSKISAVTFFGAGAIKDLPNMGNWVRTYGAEGRGSYTYNTNLGSMAIKDFEWEQHISAQARRDSGYCSDFAGDSDHSGGGGGGGRRWSNSSSTKSHNNSSSSSSPIYHTASLQVPVALPTHKRMFVPTFHSCIVSRVYVLWLTVTVSSCGGSSTSKTTLGVPLQIGVEPDASLEAGEGAGPPTFEAAMEEAEVDELLRPRTMHVPDVEFERHALPGYGDSVGWRTATA
ncbi:arrestin protein [Apiospora arundinis]|uniref:Arrestin protein n=1 Tax=Apiospora arundinis TaxID=335852 RepID=A0ABR2IUI4_9PEZI